MRDQMRIGDAAFFYHSSCKVPGIVGLVEIVKVRECVCVCVCVCCTCTSRTLTHTFTRFHLLTRSKQEAYPDHFQWVSRRIGD